MKTPTSELEGAALDWAVAMAVCPDSLKGNAVDSSKFHEWCISWLRNGCPSMNWSQGGRLIEKYRIKVEPIRYHPGQDSWMAGFFYYDESDLPQYLGGALGGSPLIAACRAIVAAKIGPQVDVPEELL